MKNLIDDIREHLKYRPEDGVFLWKKTIKNNLPSGRVAGYKKVDRSGKTYIKITFKGVKYSAHHLAWALHYGVFPSLEIDHIDGNGCNNLISNLEEKTREENQKNKRLFSNNKSGIAGVRKVSDTKFRAEIRVDNISQHLLFTNDFFEACCARKSAERRFGFHENHGSIRPL